MKNKSPYSGEAFKGSPQEKANKKYNDKVQNDEQLKWQRNKMTTLRSARNHIRNYSDFETLDELKQLILEREEQLNNV